MLDLCWTGECQHSTWVIVYPLWQCFLGTVDEITDGSFKFSHLVFLLVSISFLTGWILT